MAVKKTKVVEKKVESVKAGECCGECCDQKKCCYSKWMVVSWTLLLIAGLGHMMPTQLAPVLGWGMYGITLQMAVGVLSVIAALYYLLEE